MFKVLQSGILWPKLFKDTFEYCSSCMKYQAALNVKKTDSNRSNMSLR